MKQLFLFLLFLSAGTIYAQTVQRPNTPPVPDSLAWTLPQCIAYAQTHNIPVQQQQLNTQLAKADLRQSQGNFLPAVNGFASHTYQYGLTVDRFTNTFANTQVVSDNFYLDGRMTLFSGFQNYNQLAQSRYQLAAAGLQTEQVKYELALSVMNAYLNVLYTDEQWTLARQQADVTQVQVLRTKILVENGAAPNGALLDLQAQLSQEEVTVITAQNGLILAYLALTQLMNLDSTNGFAIQRPPLTDTNEQLLRTPEQIFQSALQTQPGVRKAQMEYRGAEKGVAAARGALSPTISLIGSIGTGYSGAAQTLQSSTYSGVDTIGYTTSGTYVVKPSYADTYVTTPFADQLSSNLNRSIGIQVSIPIFNRFQASSEIERAKVRRMNAELAMDLQQQELRKRIDQSYADAKASLEKVQACRSALEAAQAAFRYAEEKFNAGAGNSFDYANAKNRLAAAEVNLLQARYEYYFRVKVLGFYGGEGLG